MSITKKGYLIWNKPVNSMRYELTHDSIAKQIYDKASGEVLQRRKIERAIKEAHLDFQERGASLTQENADHYKSFLNQVNITDDEEAFVVDASKTLRRARILRTTGYVVIGALFVIVLGWALLTFSYAMAQTAEKQAIELVDQAKIALNTGNLIMSLRLSQAAYDICMPKNRVLRIAWWVQGFFTFPDLPFAEVDEVLKKCLSSKEFAALKMQTAGERPTPKETFEWLQKADIPHLTSEDSTTFRLK
ncbi:MAG: hypothetical protein HKN87_21605 [Saprospiraceae bacterium]|nr:hypothetical protein [Saprospiraceae bacterium]